MIKSKLKAMHYRISSSVVLVANVLCMSSGTCTHFQITYTAYVPLLIHGVIVSYFFKCSIVGNVSGIISCRLRAAFLSNYRELQAGGNASN